jgi:hypothetical protein
MGTDNDRAVDEMCNVYALITARMNDDLEGFKQILLDGTDEDNNTGGTILALVDLCVGLLTERAMLAGVSTGTLVRSMAMITRVVGPEAIQKRERGY